MLRDFSHLIGYFKGMAGLKKLVKGLAGCLEEKQKKQAEYKPVCDLQMCAVA